MESTSAPESSRGKKPHSAIKVLVIILAAVVTGLWLINTPAGLLGKADAIGYAVCHRIDLRSFHLGERPVPLCVRCSGMYLGALTGLVYFAVRGRLRNGDYPHWPTLVVFVLFVVFWGIDGLNSFLHLLPKPVGIYLPNHLLRLVTGTLMGVILVSMLVPTFNQSIWRDQRRKRIIRSVPDLLPLLLVALGVTSLQLTGNPIILYPLALLSAASILIILTIVYAMAIGLIYSTSRGFTSWKELVFPLIGGFTLAVLQIALIDLGRFWLTGTWEGFHF